MRHRQSGRVQAVADDVENASLGLWSDVRRLRHCSCLSAMPRQNVRRKRVRRLREDLRRKAWRGHPISPHLLEERWSHRGSLQADSPVHERKGGVTVEEGGGM